MYDIIDMIDITGVKIVISTWLDTLLWKKSGYRTHPVKNKKRLTHPQWLPTLSNSKKGHTHLS